MEANSKWVRLNVALLPDEASVQQALGLSHDLNDQFDCRFRLDQTQFFCHLSVYPSAYPASQQAKLIEHVAAIASATAPIALPFSHYGGGAGWIATHYETKHAVRQLHDMCLAKLNPLRNGHVRIKQYEQDYQVELSEYAKQQITQFGYTLVQEDYRAHLSLTRLSDDALSDQAKAFCAAQQPSWSPATCTRLGVFLMGSHGACIELLASHPLAAAPAD